ncbi:MAG: hypothetical protein ACTHK4_13165, partial [Mycobacteriales bacterium]
VSGCNASALTKRELVFYFDSSASTAQHRAALDACAHVTPEATPEPFSTSGPVANQVGNVRFRIDHADDKAIAQIEECMDRQAGVKGVDIPDLTD